MTFTKDAPPFIAAFTAIAAAGLARASALIGSPFGYGWAIASIAFAAITIALRVSIDRRSTR